MATYTPTAKFDRSAIMKAAWRLYRMRYAVSFGLDGLFNRADFSECLKIAWEDATADTITRRIADLKEQIRMVEYLPVHMNAARRRSELTAELVKLAA